MSAPIIDLKDLLEADGVGVFGSLQGWGIFIGEEPAQPINAITLFDTDVRAPLIPIDTLGPGPIEKSAEYPGTQIRVRSSTYEDAYDRARLVLNRLTNRGEFIAVDGLFKYLNIFWQSGPLPIGDDDKTRFIFSINFMSVRTPIITP